MVLLGFRVARQDDLAAIGGRQMNIDHLDRGHFFDHRPGRQPRGQGLCILVQRHLQAVGHEGDKDVCFDAMLELVMDGPDR